jgi:hypothetical protein
VRQVLVLRVLTGADERDEDSVPYIEVQFKRITTKLEAADN